MIDLAIVGGGPAGLTAALYAARAGLSAVVFEGLFSGGQAATTAHIENYPGFPKGIGGPELAMLMEEQARAAGAEMRYESVSALTLAGDVKSVHTTAGDAAARAVVLCMGATPRKLGVDGEDRLAGMGVSYCATCDGALFRGKPVAVVGGGNTALEDALYLARLCPIVYLIHRRNELRADAALQARMHAMPGIVPYLNAKVAVLNGERALTALTLDTDQGERQVQASALFVAVGTQPRGELCRGQVDMTAEGYVRAGEDGRTSLPLVFAAGDLRKKPMRQIVTAMADGANAAESARLDLLRRPAP